LNVDQVLLSLVGQLTLPCFWCGCMSPTTF